MVDPKRLREPIETWKQASAGDVHMEELPQRVCPNRMRNYDLDYIFSPVVPF